MGTYLCFPLPQHRLRSSSFNLGGDILRGLCVATCVIYPSADIRCIHPDKLLCLVEPLHLELLLTDGADTVCEGGIIGNWQVLQLSAGSGGGSVLRGFRRDSSGFAFYFTGFDPVLDSCENRFVK